MALDEVLRKSVHTQTVMAVGDSEKSLFDLVAEAARSLEVAVAQFPKDASLAGLTISVHKGEVLDKAADDLVEVPVAVGTVTYTTEAA